jgi:hypothetical protein
MRMSPWQYGVTVLLSINSYLRTDDRVMKKVTEREQDKIPCPKAVVNYIQNMGDADILDEILDYGLSWLSKKW